MGATLDDAAAVDDEDLVGGPDGGQQFTTQFTFNPDIGLLQSSTDENNQQTSLQYDNMYRVITVTPPAPAGVITGWPLPSCDTI